MWKNPCLWYLKSYTDDVWNFLSSRLSVWSHPTLIAQSQPCQYTCLWKLDSTDHQYTDWIFPHLKNTWRHIWQVFLMNQLRWELPAALLWPYQPLWKSAPQMHSYEHPENNAAAHSNHSVAEFPFCSPVQFKFHPNSAYPSHPCFLAESHNRWSADVNRVC